MAQAPPQAHEGCETVRDLISRLGDKWSMLAVDQLGGGPLRFRELQRRCDGVSQRMLTVTLRRLERDGLVWRKVTPAVPVQVTYGLTDLGRGLLGVLQPFFAWTGAQAGAIAAAQRAYDARE